jgi:hypothetical protein
MLPVQLCGAWHAVVQAPARHAVLLTQFSRSIRGESEQGMLCYRHLQGMLCYRHLQGRAAGSLPSHGYSPGPGNAASQLLWCAPELLRLDSVAQHAGRLICLCIAPWGCWRFAGSAAVTAVCLGSALHRPGSMWSQNCSATASIVLAGSALMPSSCMGMRSAHCCESQHGAEQQQQSPACK